MNTAPLPARNPHAVLALSVVLMLIWLSDIAWQASTRQAGCVSPPHILLYATGLLLGLASVWAAVSMKRASSAGHPAPPQPRAVIQVHWITAGLAALLLATLPFDCFWQGSGPPASGALTAPHIAQAVLILALQLSVWITGGSLERRDRRDARLGTRIAPLVSAGMVLLWFWTMALEYVGWANLWHGSQFYLVAGAIFPIWLVTLARSARQRWSATGAAAVYIVSVLITIWIVQSVPVSGSASAGSSSDATTMVPPPFPLLLIVPGLAIDSIMRRFDRGGGPLLELVLAGAIGLVFVVALLLVHWPLSDFLLSPLARNYAFAADRWPHYAPAGGWRYEYWNLDPGLRVFGRGMALASLTAVVSAFLGLRVGALLMKPAETG